MRSIQFASVIFQGWLFNVCPWIASFVLQNVCGMLSDRMVVGGNLFSWDFYICRVFWNALLWQAKKFAQSIIKTFFSFWSQVFMELFQKIIVKREFFHSLNWSFWTYFLKSRYMHHQLIFTSLYSLLRE